MLGGGLPTPPSFYDAENRIIEVKKNDNVIAAFVYDENGNRVKSVMGSETILFVGGHYEVTNPGSGQTVTKYYFAGASRIAMRKYTIPQSMTVEYMLGDHLGSTSITTDSSGNKVSEMRYKAWGEVRYSWTSSPSTAPAYELTKYTFTGQYSYMDDPSTSGVTEGFGLMFYNARWYDPALGRFAQADTIIPGGVQGYDRYAYVNNSPIRYTDPSGHKLTCEVDENCKQSQRLSRFTGANYWKSLIKDDFGITMSDKGGKVWDIRNLSLGYSSLQNIDTVLKGKLKSLVGGATFELGNYKETKKNCPDGGCTYGGLTSGTTVTFNTMGNAAIRQMNIYHEFGHLLDNSPGMVDKFSNALKNLKDPSFITDKGYLDRDALINDSYINDDPNCKNVEAVQHSYSSLDDLTVAAQEHWGDIFVNYVAGNIDLSDPSGPGIAMNNFIKGMLP